jgi:hypothetical protein
MDLETAIDQQRTLNSAAKRASRIYRKKSVPARPFAALDEIKAKGPMAQMGREFAKSQEPAKRAGRVKDAKDNGTFDAIRERYNTQYAGKYSMDKDGNISGSGKGIQSLGTVEPSKPATQATADSKPATQANPASKPATQATADSKPAGTPPKVARPESQKDDVVVARKGLTDRIKEKYPDGYTTDSPFPKQTAGEMIKDIDGAIAKNKEAVSGLNKSFARKKRNRKPAPAVAATPKTPAPTPTTPASAPPAPSVARARTVDGGTPAPAPAPATAQPTPAQPKPKTQPESASESQTPLGRDVEWVKSKFKEASDYLAGVRKKNLKPLSEPRQS